MILDGYMDGIHITNDDPIVKEVDTPITINASPIVTNTNVFSFLDDPQKKTLLTTANEILHINKGPYNKIVFVYSAPKVGSTSIVSSLRLFGIDKFYTIHIHDEEMLRVIAKINGITINEIILFNKYLGKDVYVIDVFRCPIERKISAYFEKIGAYHFNNHDSIVNKYNVKKVINRFNKIFPHIANGDHFLDEYNIPVPSHFDWNNKYLQINHNGVNYIKLRLRDSELWGDILSKLLETKICIVKDYETSKKAVKDLYAKFKTNYKIPKNLLDDVINSSYIEYFFSPSEKEEYYTKWLQKSTDNFIPYTSEQYKMYEDLTLENSHLDYIQSDHYMDEGCRCKACLIKRKQVVSKILCGIETNDRIIHDIAKQELLKSRIDKMNIVNHSLVNGVGRGRGNNGGKDFAIDMKSVVSGKIKY